MLKSTLYQIFAIPTNGEKTNRFFEQPTLRGFAQCIVHPVATDMHPLTGIKRSWRVHSQSTDMHPLTRIFFDKNTSKYYRTYRKPYRLRISLLGLKGSVGMGDSVHFFAGR